MVFALQYFYFEVLTISESVNFAINLYAQGASCCFPTFATPKGSTCYECKRGRSVNRFSLAVLCNEKPRRLNQPAIEQAYWSTLLLPLDYWQRTRSSLYARRHPSRIIGHGKAMDPMYHLESQVRNQNTTSTPACSQPFNFICHLLMVTW